MKIENGNINAFASFPFPRPRKMQLFDFAHYSSSLHHTLNYFFRARDACNASLHALHIGNFSIFNFQSKK
jgi:hypothetical protein